MTWESNYLRPVPPRFVLNCLQSVVDNFWCLGLRQINKVHSLWEVAGIYRIEWTSKCMRLHWAMLSLLVPISNLNTYTQPTFVLAYLNQTQAIFNGNGHSVDGLLLVADRLIYHNTATTTTTSTLFHLLCVTVYIYFNRKGRIMWRCWLPGITLWG